ncbi:BON domain-containing protein [Cupriavidus sp. WKF15]|uniref:BON domain-containing protein n=1 Tax=Cupriavidus sp. WKF15 TaxID=3032282 RepID=UPI0023E13CDA|nr:BON domain-containing protein [Cupriavidus sp. WKF15]WER49330.1 BON domain-containing protein [Cupriavidus sp. WKF15]
MERTARGSAVAVLQRASHFATKPPDAVRERILRRPVFLFPQPEIAMTSSSELEAQVRARIAEAFAGSLPQGLAIEVADRRVTLTGCVDSPAVAQEIEKAAAISPGVLGVHNALRTRHDDPPLPAQPDANHTNAIPVAPPAGQIHHKV